MRLDHPIFHQPLDVDLEFTDTATPENYRTWPGGRELGATIRTWKVHEGKFPDIDVGMVSDPYGFEDTPDAEWISSGLNSKGPTSVALGRVGNFFHWGFFGDPASMTESAQRVFVNTLCWMTLFDGQRPLLPHKSAQSREWAMVYVGYIHELGDMDTTFTSYSAEGEKKQSAQEFLRSLFDADLLAAAGQAEGKLDGDALEHYYQENFEFLIPGSRGMVVDADVKSLGVSNRRPEFLDVLAQRLAADPQDELARRCAQRYLPPSAPQGAAVVEWLKEHRDRLYFSDAGGFHWFETPEHLLLEAESDPLPEPTPTHPVVAGLSFDPATVAPGATLTLVVRVRTAPTWHIYPTVLGASPNSPTVLQLALPAGVESVGDWILPVPHREPTSGALVLEGDLEFRHALRVSDTATAGELLVRCLMDYQTCDPFHCLPPDQLELQAKLKIR